MAPAIPADSLAFPYPPHLKSSSPQKPVQDMEIKPGIFPGGRIIIEASNLQSMLSFFERRVSSARSQCDIMPSTRKDHFPG
jgi:hypothetical protein